MQLAQINIARMLAPIGSATMKEFEDNLDRINALAEAAPGFVWRLKDDNNNATSIKVFDDDFIIVNLSVWSDHQSLSDYVYKSDHVEMFKKRAAWFSRMREMHMALWYIEAGQYPTVQEAVDRLNHLRKHGDTPQAFSFRTLFEPPS